MDFDILHIATLSRLKIDPREEEKFANEMANIIQMVEHLPDIQGDGTLIDPDHPMTMRKDEVEPSFRRDELLKNAPQVQAGCVVVPKVME